MLLLLVLFQNRKIIKRCGKQQEEHIFGPSPRIEQQTEYQQHVRPGGVVRQEIKGEQRRQEQSQEYWRGKYHTRCEL